MKTVKEYLEKDTINESNDDLYAWKDINEALMKTSFGPKVILKVLMNLKGKKVKK